MVGKEDDPASYWLSVAFQGAFPVKLREGNDLKISFYQRLPIIDEQKSMKD